MTHRNRSKLRAVVILAALLLPASLAGADPAPEPESLYAYHVRIVRVSGAGSDPGAALGWEANGGKPVLVPSLEAWGSPEQLRGLASALGGERADAVTGFIVQAGADGTARFHRKVYVEDSVVELEFRALPPAGDAEAHRVNLTLLDQADPAVALAEAELRVLTDRTVAIASPSPVENDWLVLAVTLVDQRGRLDSSGDAVLVTEDGIEAPEIVHKVAPRYPEAAKRNRIQGQVMLQIVIDREGVPRAPMVLRMTEGCEELAAAAVDAVSQWRYEPARLDGEPVAVWMTVAVKFRLQ